MKRKIIKKVLPMLLFSPLVLATVSCGEEKIESSEQHKGSLTIICNSTQGNVDVTGLSESGSLILNGFLTFNVAAKEGYKLKSLTVNGEDITATLKFKVTNPEVDYVVEVKFEKIVVTPPTPDPEPTPDPDDNKEPEPDPEPNPSKPDPETTKDEDKPTEELAKKYSSISVGKAIDIAEKYGNNNLSREYCVYGIVTKINSKENGNMEVTYKNKTIFVSSPSNWSKYKDILSVGDEIVLNGKLNTSADKAQIKSPAILEYANVHTKPIDPSEDSDKPTEELAVKYNCISVNKVNEIATAVGNIATNQVFCVYGVLKEVSNEKYGDLYIEQAGKKLFIFCPKNWNAYKDKLSVGDEIVFQGSIKAQNGTPQLYKPQILDMISHNSKPVEPDKPSEDPDKPTEDLAVKYDCISITKAIEIGTSAGDTATTEKYYIYGSIDQISNIMDGTMQIKQANKVLNIYKPQNWNAYKDKVSVGDEIVFQGSLKFYDSFVELFKPNIVEYIDRTVNPEPEPQPEPDKNSEVVDGVTYTHTNKIQVEKIYDSKYIGGDYTFTKEQQSTFYDSSYVRAGTYQEAVARSAANLLSGDFEIPQNIANYANVTNPKSSNGAVFYNARARYIFDNPDCSGEPIGYIINDTDGDDSNDDVIFKGGAYVTMDDVSAYLFAFHCSPANWVGGKSKSDRKKVISDWGQYGRVNDAYFSGDTSSYPFEPTLTGINVKFSYYETDFGTDGNFEFYTQHDHHNMHPQKPYYQSNNINRGTCRFVYSHEQANGQQIGLDGERHIFYTWSHYNDFEEYLNYKGGYGPKFGNLVVGNEYDTHNPVNPVGQPSDYVLANFGK